MFLVVVAVLASSPARAGSTKDGVYLSNHGYQITPPLSWTAVDGSNRGLYSETLPPSLLKADTKAYDVLFFDAELPPAGDGPAELQDSLMVMVIPSKGKAGDDASVIFKESTEAFAKGIVAAMKPHLEKLFSNVESKSAVAGKHGAIDTIDLLWGVAGEGGSNEGFILQTIIPGPEYTLLVTCSLGKARYEERKDACVAAVDSVKLNP
ncbi:MAG: hypothetical protein AUK47_15280 [Deltaproteobacteria bacterium CG2_30_63_29]|nr:MAG: hypothetical protein AUK47_15280 [Deltaproteobacteria bacterium CG2_30_63_29]PJB40818.1 MAG: hypothetical protein CO108_14175 [Deltaproteobacteria bacterium CG_4_9_14_3_um_filter_63_12]